MSLVKPSFSHIFLNRFKSCSTVSVPLLFTFIMQTFNPFHKNKPTKCYPIYILHYRVRVVISSEKIELCVLNL